MNSKSGAKRGRLRRWFEALTEPRDDPQLAAALARYRLQLPTLWLLGKTGAGKSSIVARLTGDTRAEVGNGFEPCTPTARLYEHPVDQPVMRFLDTRGLGEVDYDPHRDLAELKTDSHALLLVVRVDDPNQTDLHTALAALGALTSDFPVLLVHTALHTVADPSERDRGMAFNARGIEAVLGRTVPAVAIDFTAPEDGFEDPDVGLTELLDAIIAMVPALATVLSRCVATDREQALFLAQRRRILGYCGAAAALDLMPALGLVAVPSLQGKMLHALATRYAVRWDASSTRNFLAALGTSFLIRYALSFAGRQLGKLIPLYGQSVGAAAAASVSFATTYALGRAACLYLYRLAHHAEIDGDELRTAFRAAFHELRQAAMAARGSAADSRA